MNWQEILLELSVLINNQADENMIYYDESLVEDNWLGYSPASNEEIQLKEQELGVTLPESYINFLKTSNGFKQISLFSGNLLPVSKIDWIENKDKEFCDITRRFSGDLTVPDTDYFVYDDTQRFEFYRTKYLLNSVMISDWTDGSVILLNPNVWTGNECEAWVFANWMPGAQRYKSFEDLITGELKSTIELINRKNK
jgi:hypothetical protein